MIVAPTYIRYQVSCETNSNYINRMILNKLVSQVIGGIIATSTHLLPYKLASKILNSNDRWIRMGSAWVFLNVKSESHTKYTSWHSNMITVHVERLSTKPFCINNE